MEPPIKTCLSKSCVEWIDQLNHTQFQLNELWSFREKWDEKKKIPKISHNCRLWQWIYATNRQRKHNDLLWCGCVFVGSKSESDWREKKPSSSEIRRERKKCTHERKMPSNGKLTKTTKSRIKQFFPFETETAKATHSILSEIDRNNLAEKRWTTERKQNPATHVTDQSKLSEFNMLAFARHQHCAFNTSRSFARICGFAYNCNSWWICGPLR